MGLGNDPTARTFMTNFKICNDPHYVHPFREPGFSMREGEPDEIGIPAYRLVSDITRKAEELGIMKVVLSSYRLTIVIYPAFDWLSVEKVVFETLRREFHEHFQFPGGLVVRDADFRTKAARLFERVRS